LYSVLIGLQIGLALVVTRREALVGWASGNGTVVLYSRLGRLISSGRVPIDSRAGPRANAIVLKEVCDLGRIRAGFDGVGSERWFDGSIERSLSRSQEGCDILLSNHGTNDGLRERLARGGRDISRSGDLLRGVADVPKGGPLRGSLKTTDCHHGGESSGRLVSLMEELVRRGDRVFITLSTESSGRTLGLG
jgi:hypothetical protein